MSEKFFEERTEESRVKAEIVGKYFKAWAKIMANRSRSDRIAYIDLFSGPGRYKDGAPSVPLKVLETSINDELLRNCLVTLFNDRDSNNTETLTHEISNLDNIETLKHKPSVVCNEVGEDVVKYFESLRLVPTLFFVDPWGYKGLSLRLVNSVLKNWGSDCIFFFNYNRINMGINNNIVREHMEALFGEERAEYLRKLIIDMNPIQREMTVVEEIAEALRDMGGNHVLPFCFKNEKGTRTSHYLIFVSKHPLGYIIMKDVMASASSLVQQGVASFTYCQADEDTPMLFDLARPLLVLNTSIR